MRNLKLTLSYDGAAYAGWQVQLDDPTVQGTLEQALQKITGETIRTVASGRTDAGVHALGQVVSLASECSLATDVLLRALNGNLPCDIRVLDVSEAKDGFHAIRDAIGKRYRYVLQDGPIQDVFARRYAWYIPGRLDAEAMHRAAQPLAGRHDFASFESSGSERASSVRTITDISVQRGRENRADHIFVEVAADGFLYNMVRAIVGTLVEVGRGAQPQGWPAEVLAARQRGDAGQTAPPQGLFLVHVSYEKEQGKSKK